MSKVYPYLLVGGPHAGQTGQYTFDVPWPVLMQPNPQARGSQLDRYVRRTLTSPQGRQVYEFDGTYDARAYHRGVQDGSGEPPPAILNSKGGGDGPDEPATGPADSIEG